ncbi:MAG: hypothetical protein A3B90_01720 [Candidatus Magasanikbacteria bacterium RIFCSPHIGHO2_02_FULL_41_13]|uniref:Uncharacterized protein n=1 Tax=Candidatus Magasanikbacteria bacterium RIFCSPHIGHO2_02_FULL_41_13 TaxID=1798676 RepID=A0A1F6M3P6_9BACT|nr:MAG: hypothetical protein A3B90_01720 [Candidatus Magasanikbacteria bacterium RIFCSPHIGHO2_02_FULL_41_13]
MEETWKKEFTMLVESSGLKKNIQKRLLVAIEKLSLQEQNLLLIMFQKFPEKIPAFWELSLKKFDYVKNGVGNLDEILEEEIKLFS